MKRADSRWKAASDGAVQVQATRGARAIAEAVLGADRIGTVAGRYANAGHINHAAGRVFEEMQAATASVNSALKGLPQRFATTAGQGLPTDSADITARVGGRVVARVQAKLLDSSTALVRRVSEKAYDGMQKVVPAGRAARVRELACALAQAGCALAENAALEACGCSAGVGGILSGATAAVRGGSAGEVARAAAVGGFAGGLIGSLLPDLIMR